MVKKIAVIQDLSGFGKCSLTAAIPVISVMGVQPCPLPTAVLSAQTGYLSYYLDDYTDKMEYIRSEWEKLGAHFDGIYTGFVASEDQIDRIFERFYRVDKSHSKERGGTGLGLSIVKHGVMLHHGEVYVESKLGEGTRIELVFP